MIHDPYSPVNISSLIDYANQSHPMSTRVPNTFLGQVARGYGASNDFTRNVDKISSILQWLPYGKYLSGADLIYDVGKMGNNYVKHKRLADEDVDDTMTDALALLRRLDLLKYSPFDKAHTTDRKRLSNKAREAYNRAVDFANFKDYMDDSFTDKYIDYIQKPKSYIEQLKEKYRTW